MVSTRIWQKIDVILGRVSSIFYGFGSGILAVLMVFTFVDVALRYFFNSPLKGGVALSEYMMVLVIPSGLALTALKKKHIKVDVFTQLLPKRVHLGLTVFSHLLGLALVVLMAWQTFEYARSFISSGIKPTTTPIPYYPFAIIAAMYLLMFALVLLRDLISTTRALISGKQEGDADVTG